MNTYYCISSNKLIIGSLINVGRHLTQDKLLKKWNKISAENYANIKINIDIT